MEWDHDYDLSRDLETAVSRALHSEEEEEGQSYLRGAAGLTGMIKHSPLISFRGMVGKFFKINFSDV